MVRTLLVIHIARSLTAKGQKKNAALATGGGIALLTALSLAIGGPRHNLINTMLGTTWLREESHVNGQVAPGFESVRRAFERNVKAGFEKGAQFVVYCKFQHL